MIVNKLIVNSFSKFKSINSSHQLRQISYRDALFKDSSSTKDDSVKADKSENTQKKLKDLLRNLAKNPETPEIPPEKKVELAKPRQLQRQNLERRKEQKLLDEKDERKKPLGTRLEMAAKDVAKMYDGDQGQTESELLNILLSYKSRKGTKNIQDVVSGMKTEKSSKEEEVSSAARRSLQVREALSKRGLPSKLISKKAKPWIPNDNLKLFEGKPLGIFPDNYMKTVKKDTVNLPTWDAQYQRQIKLAGTHPPRNIYQEMIQWTEEGKLWHFPIDNEQGMDEEKKVSFSDHVLLYDLLEPWCPPKGPVRHFMELVCVGLSKNPYYSVQEKREHINWYHKYFQEKNHLLKETGCGEIVEFLTDSDSKQNEVKA